MVTELEKREQAKLRLQAVRERLRRLMEAKAVSE